MKRPAASKYAWQMVGRVAAVMLGLLLAAGVARAQAIAPEQVRPRDLLAAAGLDHFWIARVSRVPQDNSFDTTISFRGKWSGNSDWTVLPDIPDRVVSMAGSQGELLMVLADGQWEIADDTDIRSGPTSSAWDTMLAIATGGDAVWAVVRNSGAATQESAATNPTTEPATHPEVDTRLMVSEFSGGSWSKGIPLPGGVSSDPAQISLCVAGGMPVLAWRAGATRLAVTVLSAKEGWSNPVVLTTPGGPIDFKLMTLNDNEHAVLWMSQMPSSTRPATQPSLRSAGVVLIGDDFTRRIALDLPKPLNLKVGSQTLVAAFGNLRWIAYAGDQQIEQDFSLDAFPRSFPPANMSVLEAPKPSAIPLGPWLGGDALLVLLAGLAAVRQKNLPAAEKPDEKEPGKPRLAPLGVRFVAGMVDLAPILAVIVMLHPATTGNPFAGIDANSLRDLSLLSVATYVAHTMAAELICGQSIGKIVFNLRVMGMDAKPAKPWQIVLRNLLRAVDAMMVLPLLLVLITPLQQRVGDLAGGTVVATISGEEEGEE